MSRLNQKVALITGITGQDGSYLAELLLEKGYEVHGMIRRSSSFNTDRIDHLYKDPHLNGVRLFLHYGDMSDSSSLNRIVEKIEPSEIYNLAAQSFVPTSWRQPLLTGEVTKIAVLPNSENRWMNPDVKVYETNINIEGNNDWLKPGMSAQVEIVAGVLNDVVYIPLDGGPGGTGSAASNCCGK